jgi:hypothetical protein
VPQDKTETCEPMKWYKQLIVNDFQDIGTFGGVRHNLPMRGSEHPRVAF